MSTLHALWREAAPFVWMGVAAYLSLSRRRMQKRLQQAAVIERVQEAAILGLCQRLAGQGVAPDFLEAGAGATDNEKQVH